jgi:hypothetical protein
VAVIDAVCLSGVDLRSWLWARRDPHRRSCVRFNDASVIRLAGALLSEQNDEWLVQRRYLSVESMQLILDAEQFRANSLAQDQVKEVAELNAA